MNEPGRHEAPGLSNKDKSTASAFSQASRLKPDPPIVYGSQAH